MKIDISTLSEYKPISDQVHETVLAKPMTLHENWKIRKMHGSKVDNRNGFIIVYHKQNGPSPDPDVDHPIEWLAENIFNKLYMKV